MIAVKIVTLSTFLLRSSAFSTRGLNSAVNRFPSLTPCAFVSTTTTNTHGKTKYPFFRTQVKMSSSGTESKKQVLVPIADDSEEIETSCITDTLVRFGANVVVASVKPDGELLCKMSRGLKIMADISIEEAAKQSWDLIALPGGLPGAEHLRDSEHLITLLKSQSDQKKLYGAVCASPAVVLATHSLLPESGATCYPAPPFRSVLKDPSDDIVVIQDNVITSKGPGTSLEFALTLGEKLFGKEEADKVAAGMLVER